MKNSIFNAVCKTRYLALLVVLIFTCGNAWGTSVTYQHVFNAKPSTGSSITLSSVSWNITATNLGSYNSGNYAGVQLGSNKSNGSITLTSSSAWGSVAGTYKDKTKITEIRLWLNLGGTSVTPSVTIGGTAAVSDGTTVVKNSSAGSDWTKATQVTFTPATGHDEGVVVISVSTVKAGYICCMEIDCEESSGGGCTAPTITAQPTGATYTQNDVATAMSITASGTSVTYQWYSNTSNSTSGASPISGATSSSYTPPTSTVGTKYYYCVASSSTCTTTSNIVSVVVNAPRYTVSFSTGTGNPTQANIQEASGGSGITLPAGPTPSCSDDGWTFIGWKETSACSSTTTAPDMLGPGSKYYPASNCTLYAVYYKQADSNPNYYTKVTTSSDNLTSGQYVIYANGEAMNNVITSNKIAGVTQAETSSGSGIISTSTAAIIWIIYKNGTNYQLYNAAVGKYLEVTGENQLALQTSSKGFTLNAFNTSTGQVSLKSVNKTSYQFQYYNGNFSAYGSQSTAIYFYKRGGTYNSNPTCCTQYTVTRSGSPAGTVTGGTFTVDKESACEGATVTLTATPSANYRFNSWTISKAAGTVSPADASSASTTFTMPGEAVTVTASFTAKCQTPTFNVAAGTYNNDQTVTISCATTGVTIKYTTDGRDPATYGTTYSTPVTINADNTTLKAVAIKAGHENSEVASATYRLKCATPTFTPTPGLVDSKYLGTQSVAFNTTTTGSITFYYTTDGSTTPTTSSTEYSSAIDVSSTTTLKAIATKANYQNSDVATQTFTITNAYTVTWMNRGSQLTTTRVEEGEKPAFPTTAKTGCDTYTSFYGWANNTWNGGKTTIAAPPADLAAYTTSSAMPEVDGDVTYHAVWTNSFRDIHTSNLTLPSSSPTNGVKCQIHVESGDGYASYTAFKLGKTDQTSANITVTVPANTTYLSLHGVGWNSGTAQVVVSTEAEGVEITTATSPTTLQPQYNARGTIRTSDDILFNDGHDFVEYSLSGVSTATTLTIASSGYPIIIWGINSATASGAPKYITSCCTPVSDRNAAVTAYDDESVTVRWDAVDNISNWAIVAKRTSDASTTGISIGDITTPTTGKRQCVISGLQPNTGYTITINGTAESGYCDTSDELTQTTSCTTPAGLSIASTDNKWDFCAGETMTLTLSGTSGTIASGATYQWKKWNGSSWDNISGANSASYSTTMAASTAGQYCCTVTNPGSGTCSATSGGVWVRVWQLHLGDDDIDFTYVSGTTGNNTAVHLNSDTHYEFKLKDNNGGWFGLNDKTITATIAAFALNGTGSNVNVTSGLEGNYTFTINYSDKNNPTIAVTYPVGNQPSGRSIWFDKSVVTSWNSEGTSDLFYRIGKSTNHTNNTKTGGTAWTLVPGTDKFYTTKTMAYDGFEAWAISNNAAWCDNSDDTHSIYGNATDSYKITKAIDFQKYVVGASGVTIVPTSSHNTDGTGCNYWYVSKTDGMLTHTATITTPSHGTIHLAYTDVNSTAQDKTSTTAGLAHRTKITATATPADGYQLSTFTVTPEGESAQNLTSGATDNHILAKNATFAAEFGAKTITITWNGNGGTPSKASDTWVYDAAALASLPSATNGSKIFVGWFTLADGGSQIDNVGGSNKPTADVEYFAHWSDGNTVYFNPGAGTVTPASATQTSIGGSVPLPTPTPTCDGWTFQGWKVGSTQAEVTELPDGLVTGSYVPESATVQMYAVYKKTFDETAPVTRTFSWDGSTNTYWTIDPNDVTRITSSGTYHNSGQLSGDHSFTFNSKVKVKSVSFKFLRSSNNTTGTLWICKSTTNTAGSWDDTGVCGVRDFALPSSKDVFQEYASQKTDFDGETEYYVRIEYQSSGSSATRYVDDISVTYNDVTSVTHYATSPLECSQVATPVISPEGDTYTGAQSITITCATAGATIKYTTDGTDPSSSNGTTIATGSSFTLSCSGTVKAIAYKDGMADSDIAAETYIIKVPDPSFSPDGGDFKVAQSVSLSSAFAGTTVYYEYTTDGSEPSDPTSSSTAYSSTPISVAVGQTVRIKAIGINGCATNSNIVSKTFRVGWDFELVTDEDDLNVGDKIVILSGSTAALSTYQGSNNRTSSSDFDISGTTVTAYPASTNSSTTVQVLTLAGGAGEWRLKPDASHYLNVPSDGKLTTHSEDGNSRQWTIDIGSSPNYYATITNNEYTSCKIEYGTVFAAYSTGQNPVKIYSIANPDPLIKVEGTLTAFAGCTGAASDAQSFYVSGKNLSASILVTAPTGYEVSLSSGSGYAASVELTRTGTAVSKTQVYVRLKSGSAGAVAATNVVVSVEANSLSQNVVIPASTISAADTYIDRMHGAATQYGCGSYSAPTLVDFEGEGTDCQENYAIFQGWVAADQINLDGTLKAGATVVAGGASKTADGTTYYSIWEAIVE